MNRGVLLILALGARAFCQDIDTVIFEHAARKSFTIIDQIEDPAERKAFQALSEEKNPAKRRRLAEGFLEKHPQSRFLSHAYEVASKAAGDLDDLDAALDYGAKSLRLLPENPLLLVSLANVQVHKGLLNDAESSATEALELLDRFRHPARYSDEKWAELEPQLRASCYYVLGRVAVARAVPANGAEKAKLTRQARDLLLKSRSLFGGDAPAAYLAGLTCLALGDRQEAASHFADAHRLGGSVGDRALKQLSALGVEASAVSRWKPVPQVAEGVPAAAPSDYAGSSSCKSCHLKIYESWSKTGMARMFRLYEPDNVFGDFANNNVFRGPDGVPIARAFLEGGRHWMEFLSGSGPSRRFPVDYTIGSKWQQAYATRLESGRIHVFPIQYNRLRNEWLNFWKIIDPPGSERAKVEAFPQLTDLTSYQRNCAPCHTSQLAVNGNEVSFQETGVNCEMCHGPSGAHAKNPAQGPAPVRFGKIDGKEYVAICGQCHMQSRTWQPGWNAKSRNVPYPELSVKAFYKDGRFRETTFIVESLMRSACYRKGGVSCGHCHNPHPDDPASNPKSLKFLDRPDQMCLQCHERMAADIEAHTHHKAASEASRCVSCHMPKIMNSLMFKAATHTIDDIPQRDMTARFGQEESPNACQICHKS